MDGACGQKVGHENSSHSGYFARKNNNCTLSSFKIPQ